MGPDEMAARKGNKNRLKFKTPEDRKRLFQELVQHVEQGFALKSFPACGKDTLREYIRRFPEDFPREELERAYRLSCKKDEAVGMAASNGQYLPNFDPSRFNARVWAMRMHNRHGWSLGGGPKETVDPVNELFGEEQGQKTNDGPLVRLEVEIRPRQEPGES